MQKTWYDRRRRRRKGGLFKYSVRVCVCVCVCGTCVLCEIWQTVWMKMRGEAGWDGKKSATGDFGAKLTSNSQLSKFEQCTVKTSGLFTEAILDGWHVLVVLEQGLEINRLIWLLQLDHQFSYSTMTIFVLNYDNFNLITNSYFGANNLENLQTTGSGGIVVVAKFRRLVQSIAKGKRPN